MQISNSITCLLSFILLSSSFALNQPEGRTGRSKEERHRKLFLFNEQRCNQRAAVCRASVEEVPIKQWSSLLRQMTGEENDLLRLVRVIVNEAEVLDVDSLLEDIQSNLSNTRVFKIISASRGFLRTANSVFNYVGDGDYSSAIDAIMELIFGTTEMFGASQDSLPGDEILSAIMQIVDGIEALIIGGIEAVFDILGYIIVGLAEFFVGLFRTIIGVITGDSEKPMSLCKTDYLQCQFDKLLLNAVPNSMKLIFLTAGETALK
jgi:hypothetical protein